MSTSEVERLRSIKTFPSLVKYLRDELDWPIELDHFDDLDPITFDYTPEELGLDSKLAVQIKQIKRLRRLPQSNLSQPLCRVFENRFPTCANNKQARFVQRTMWFGWKTCFDTFDGIRHT